ncbi:DUF4197 domain-containing protein [Campylobacter sp. faydin G-24]|uniref:DUF4197 domain-containing protein n=1 Tax=Campylobacter anatolicus TaxID=2829105 RepID=A0ABS5HJQ7_9BACT|nr:DUF4197 domain-containing protein [Campylobacter anatolicus]MBR8464498.1 DUF4197 domain-containing protein [Campylobacter anatolicus]
MRKFVTFLLLCCLAIDTNANLSDAISSGLKVASSLSVSKDYKAIVSNALNLAVKELSNGGYLNSAVAKIPLPNGLQRAANLAKKVGGEKWANELIISINNAASTAVPEAASIFSDTIKNMNNDEIKSVMSGGKDSFTKFLQDRSGDKLQKVFKPIIKNMMSDNKFATAYNGLNSFIANSSVTSSDTIKSVKNLASNLGMSEYVPDSGEDLNDYITRKTLDGLFNVMSEKESGLKSGIVGKGNGILNKVLK